MIEHGTLFFDMGSPWTKLPLLKGLSDEVDFVYFCMRWFGLQGSAIALWQRSGVCSPNCIVHVCGPIRIHTSDDNMQEIETALAITPRLPGESENGRYIRVHELVRKNRKNWLTSQLTNFEKMLLPSLNEKREIPDLLWMKVCELATEFQSADFTPLGDSGTQARIVARMGTCFLDVTSVSQPIKEDHHECPDGSAVMAKLSEIAGFGDLSIHDIHVSENSIQLD